MKDLTTSQKSQLQIMLNKVKGHKKQLDNIPVQIQQLELQIQNIITQYHCSLFPPLLV